MFDIIINRLRHTKLCMAYFSYHGKAKKLIREGELVRWEMVAHYNGIRPALVLFFKSHKPMPIREYRWQEYFELLNTIEE